MKKIFALWSLFKIIILELVVIIICFLYLECKNWNLDLIAVIFIGISFTFPIFLFCVNHAVINLETIEFYYITFNKTEKLDHIWNWRIYKNEVESAEVMKLSKKTKKQLTSSKFMLNKYIKVKLISGKCKYIYVSNFSRYQIKQIIEQILDKTTKS